MKFEEEIINGKTVYFKEDMYKILFSLILIIITLFACKKLGYDADPNDTASNGNYISDTLYAISDSVVKESEIFTGFSQKIALGQRDGLNAGFLVYFSFLDTASNIDSAYMQFTTVNSYGADMVDRISANIYSVDSLWGEAANQYDRYRNPPVEKMEFVTQGTFSTKDSAINVFTIPLDFNNIWIGLNDSLADTVRFNLFFQPETGSENAIVEMGSSLFSQKPLLIYYKVSEDTTLIDTVEALVTANIFNYDEVNGTALNYPDETVIISSGIIHHSLLKFNFDELPEKAIYYRASLELTEDDLNEYENSDNKSLFELRPVESFADSIYNPNFAFGMNSDDGTTKTSEAFTSILGEDFVQLLANNSLEHEWFEVEFFFENQDFSVKRYWGANSPDQEKRPKLIINYLNANK